MNDIVLADVKQMSVHLGILPSIYPVVNSVAGLNKVHSGVIAQGGERAFFESKKVTLIFDYEEMGRDSLHYRRSGLNQVYCKLAAANGIMLGFNTSRFIHSKKKALLLGKIRQNVRLCRKYGIVMKLASFAKSEWDLRSAGEVKSLGLLFGMTALEAKKAVQVLPEI